MNAKKCNHKVHPLLNCPELYCDIMALTMNNFTHLIIAGVGPDDSQLITLNLFMRLEISDMILVLLSKIHEEGLAETIMAHHLHSLKYIPILFPITRDLNRR